LAEVNAPQPLGNPSQNWLILKNGLHVIGLFQGMFEKNILKHLYRRSRSAAQVEGQGVVLMSDADENTTGPGSFIAVDPDGNPIMVDQHV
jgi:lactoylglutathione lyase